MKTINFTITGISPLLLNNPQTADRFNKYAKRMSEIAAKGKRRTDEDYLELRDLEVRSKLYWDDKIKVYVPSTWVATAMESVSFVICKISKAKLRGMVFMNEDKLKLSYTGSAKLKAPEDAVKLEEFRHLMLLKQGSNKLAKAFPIFHTWSFSGSLDYEPTEVDGADLQRMLERAARYGGFGDFRPRFGKATVEVTHV